MWQLSAYILRRVDAVILFIVVIQCLTVCSSQTSGAQLSTLANWEQGRPAVSPGARGGKSHVCRAFCLRLLGQALWGQWFWAAASSCAEKWLWANWNATSGLMCLRRLSVILGQMACPAFIICHLIICIGSFSTVRNSLILLRILFSIRLQLQFHKMETQPIPLGNTMPRVGNHSRGLKCETEV